MFFRITLMFCVLLTLASHSNAASSNALDNSATEQNLELRQLQQALADMQANYQQQLAALTQRIQRLETEAQAVQQSQALSTTSLRSGSSGTSQLAANDFNPAIGVVLSGALVEFDRPVPAVPGYFLGGESAPPDKGFNLGESEFNAHANIDDKFYGNFTVALANAGGETEVELEEAWLQTLQLPAGFTLKGGRFFSGLGHRNEFHAHADDFADRSLAYRVFLNGQYVDDGVQLRWLAPTDTYLEVGAEWFKGQGFPGAGDGDRGGKGTWTLFGRVGGDVGSGGSWQAGASWLNARARDLESGDPNNPGVFTGEVNQGLVDFVWKWAPNGNPYRHNLKLEGVVIRQRHEGLFQAGAPGSAAEGVPIGIQLDQWGYSLEGVYQFMHGWRAGVRVSSLAGDDLDPRFDGSLLDDQGQHPRVLTTMLDWSNSEFSRLRLQYSRDESSARGANQWQLQYLMSVGAHGAHQF